MKKYKGKNWKLFEGDCLELCKKIPDSYFHSIVTDGPYCLDSIRKRFGKPGSATNKAYKDGAFQRKAKGFMNMEWDTDILFRTETWKSFNRVLRPGGIVLSFAATRNYHRMATAAEDAGFIIKDMIGWIHCQGMAMGINIENAMNKKGLDAGNVKGFNNTLKPSIEPIMVAVKPLSEKTIIENIQKWGVGGIYNVEGCRIPLSDKDKNAGKQVIRKIKNPDKNKDGKWGFNKTKPSLDVILNAKGRYPTNIMHDGCLEEEIAKYYFCAKAPASEKDGSSHATIKNLKLMRYLVKLVTPAQGKIFEPFSGTGTTIQAAVLEGFKVVAAEKTPKYIPDILRRMNKCA